MANLASRIRRQSQPTRSMGANETVPISIQDWAKMFAPGAQVNYMGRNYQAFNTSAMPVGESSIVYTCERARVAVFSEAGFQWQRIRSGRPQPGSLFGTPGLSLLQEPWPGGSTRDLLAIAELDVAHSGNSYWVEDGEGYLCRIEPSTMKVLTAAVVDHVSGFRIGETLVGYACVVDKKMTIFAPEDVAHYKPMPADNNVWVGQSWIAACLPDIDADGMLTEHKRATIRNGANITHVISLDAAIPPEQFDNFVEKFNEAHEGPAMAGKTLFIQGGSDIKAVGQTWESLSLKATQGSGETRIAAAAGTHPVILGLSEGLAGSALNAGNYAAAKRNFVDGTMSPLWGAFCGAFDSIMRKYAPGPDVRLWYDARDIPFMREDITDLASVMSQNATVINQLVTAGFDADAVVKAVYAGDVSMLEGFHNGLPSVQQQQDPVPPKNDTPVPAVNGSKSEMLQLYTSRLALEGTK